MFIKSIIDGIDRLIHGGKHYPVVNGIANVPQEVRDEIVSHVDWKDATDEIDKKTLIALEKANKAAEKENADPDPEKEPPDSEVHSEKK